jgi:uncharacterized protein
MDPHAIAAILSGALVGYSLGLLGGGGSILAVPLLLYAVGVRNPHVAVGTSSLAVGVNAMINLVPHTLAGHVRWRPAALFAAVGVVGATVGSSLGKEVPGRRLVLLFALLMIVLAALLQRPLPTRTSRPRARLWTVSGTGFLAGALAGFFGIGGGFLVVPGLRFAAQIPMIEAIGSSLVAVTAFGFTTAASYAMSGLIAWAVTFEFVAGGMIGGLIGTAIAGWLALRRDALNRLIGAALVAVAAYMLARGLDT